MIYEDDGYYTAAPPRFTLDDLLAPSHVLSEGELIDIAYPPETLPTYKVTVTAPKKEGLPWWVWVLLAAVVIKSAKKK